MALTPDAEKAIRDAIAIVREDRFEKFARERLTKHSEPKADPKPPGDGKPPTGDITPPPPKNDAQPPTNSGEGGNPDKPVNRHAYWGEIDSD